MNIESILAANRKPDQFKTSSYSLSGRIKPHLPFESSPGTIHCLPTVLYIILKRWVNPTPRHTAQAAAMVDPAGDGVLLLHVTIAMLTLSWVTLGARLAVRKWLKPEAMGADDYLMFTGLVRSHTPFLGAGMSHGNKRLTPDLDPILSHMLPSHCLLLLRCWTAVEGAHPA